MKNNAIWLTWETQRRNRELSDAFKIPLFEFSEIDTIENYFKKYTLGLTKTFCVLTKSRPRIVICQNPSIVLSFIVLVLKTVTNIKVVIDAHNAGLFPREGRYKLLNTVSRSIQRYADLTIVSNQILMQHVQKNCGKAFVLQDKIPELKTTRLKKLRGKYNILFICTYADDEPYKIVFEAAEKISRDIVIYVTGNYKRKGIDIGKLSENVVLTGFMPEEEYIEMINSVDATIVLTNRENCLVCGAYESVACEKPMILSKTFALMDYFNKGAVYVEHTNDSIANGIVEVIKRRNELSQQVRDLKKIKVAEWQGKKIELEAILRSLA